MEYIDLHNWGLSERHEQEAQLYENMLLARVTEQHRTLYRLVYNNGLLQGTVSGKFVYNALDNLDFPGVGDWVMIEVEGDTAVIQHILTRKSAFSRKAAGSAHALQVVAANIDAVFICMALNEDYNIRRLERYLAIAWDSGATPVVVLTKSDLCENLTQRIKEVTGAALGADVLVCSRIAEDGYKAVTPYMQQGKTIAFIGSSGVGKSTLINHLLGEDLLVTKDIGSDGKGRHATTHRQLMLLPGGGLVMDTPGMREIGAISVDFDNAFADIEEFAKSCKFKDCSHTSEPGCAILAAIKEGILDAARFENYKKLQTEANYSLLSSRQIEEEKIKRMFGGKSEMKQAFRAIKNKNR